MKKIFFDGVDIFNPLDGMLEQVVEYFVESCGEKHREKITQKINDTTFIFLPKFYNKNWSNGFVSNFNKFFKDATTKIMLEADEKFNVNLVSEFGSHYTLAYIESTKLLFEGSATLDADGKNIIRAFAKNVKKEDVAGSEEKLKEKILAQMEQYLGYVYKNKETKLFSLQKQRNYIMQELKKMLPDVQKINMEKVADLENITKSHYNRLIAGKDVDENVWEYHFDTFLEFLTMHDIPKIVPEFKQQRYVEFFNLIGLDYGDDYFAYYLNKDEIFDLIFDNKMMNLINNRIAQAKNEMIYQNEIYCSALEKIDSLNIKYLQNKQDILNMIYDFVYVNEDCGGFVVSYVEEGTNELKQICVLQDYINGSTNSTVHEINHVIESCFLGEDEYFFYTKTGFDVLPNIKEKHEDIDCYEFIKDKDFRMFECLNEIVNERLSQDIITLMDRDGFYLGLGRDESAVYNLGFYFLDGFISDNRQQIIDARMSSEGFATLVGAENAKQIAVLSDRIFYDERINVIKALEELDKLNVGIESLQHQNLSENATRFLAFYNKFLNVLDFATIKLQLKEKGASKQNEQTNKNICG